MIVVPDSPAELGFPQKLWRPHQREAVNTIVNSPRKLVLVSAPPGAGKSLQVMGAARLLAKEAEFPGDPPRKVVIATKTIQLQRQYEEEFGEWLTSMVGRSNFPCLLHYGNASVAPCNDGWNCPVQGQSPYYKQRAEASTAPIVIVNYDYLAAAWTTRKGKTSSLYGAEYLFGDEGHLADESLRSAAKVEIKPWLKEWALRVHDIERPRGKDFLEWLEWAEAVKEAVDFLQTEDLDWDDPQTYKKYTRELSAAKASTSLTSLLTYSNQIAVLEESSGTTTFQPVFASQQFSRLLGGLRKVVLLSATLPGPELTAKLLGVLPDDYEQIEIPSTFPASNRPFIFQPVAAVSKMKMTEEDYDKLAWAVVQYLDAHANLKGIIHTGAYWLQKEILERLPLGNRWTIHWHGSRGLETAVKLFAASGPGNFLMSPVAHSGVNLPDDDVRLQLILKLPFPDTTDPIIAARREYEPDTYDQQTAATVLQSYGRGVRHEQDYCTTVMLDTNWRWYYPRNLRFFPRYFQEAVQDA